MIRMPGGLNGETAAYCNGVSRLDRDRLAAGIWQIITSDVVVPVVAVSAGIIDAVFGYDKENPARDRDGGIVAETRVDGAVTVARVVGTPHRDRDRGRYAEPVLNFSPPGAVDPAAMGIAVKPKPGI